MAVLQKFVEFVPPAKRDQALTAAGSAALLTGQKLTAVGMLARGIVGLERQWRAAHPEYKGGAVRRWKLATQHYAAMHHDPTGRLLHVASVPLILGGATGLLFSPRYTPPWFLAAGAFASGWALNLAGHIRYDRDAPALDADPLAFVAGPLWDANRIVTGVQKSVARSAGVVTVGAAA